MRPSGQLETTKSTWKSILRIIGNFSIEGLASVRLSFVEARKAGKSAISP